MSRRSASPFTGALRNSTKARVAQDVRRATGGDDVTLPKNYRSRPGLVAFFNDAFARTFENAGLPPSATRTDRADRSDLPGQQTPLAIWHLSGKTIASRLEAIATGIAAAVATGSDWLVADGAFARPLAPGDIAVLCRSNDACATLAAAIARQGLKVAIERAGLFGTPEARLAFAALRWCADLRDTVALAEMAHLLHEGSEQPPWFEASLREDSVEGMVALVPIAGDLREVSASGVHKTPLEFFDAVLTRGGVASAMLRWGRAEQRFLNLEQLRGLVAEYQEERRRDRAPTTVSDLCVWLAEQEGAQPKSRAQDAVTVDTYHGSKGLEWPFVVLSDLDEEPKANAFGAHVMSDKPWDQVDWRNPLEGRWVRFWPWPFGAQRDNVGLDAAGTTSPEGRSAERIERAERVRLLYVGATRAKDYLAFAIPVAKPSLPWLEELRADDGSPAVQVPAAGATSMTVNGRGHPVRVLELAAASDTPTPEPSLAYTTASGEQRSYLPLAIRPSAESGAEDARIVAEADLGARLPISGSPDMNVVGEALHRFLAADDPALPEQGRIQMAARLLESWGVSGFDPRDVVTMGDRFRKFVAGNWPGSTLRREPPILQRIGDRTLRGRLDVVVETDSEIVLIDHKSFPGGRPQWLEQAKKHAGQMRTYREAVRAATSFAKPVRMALHLPISGEVLFIE
ncbi:3'-5' exonuclease [Roseiarcus sp.]|uniref:3'-5' exonuclease n=1 Tax=Roseiarcus sp. TaxID=1969460 RepID=UPI003F946B9A